MYVKSEGVLAVDLKQHGFYDLIQKIDEHRHEIICLIDNLYRVEIIVETTINPPSASEERKPLSITLKSEPACEIMKQIDERRMAINDLLVELKMLTAAVESDLNQSLVAVTQPENLENQTLQ